MSQREDRAPAARLPELIDCAGLQRELTIKRAPAEAIMRRLDKVTIPGVRKTYVRRADVHAYLDGNTVPADGLRRTA